MVAQGHGIFAPKRLTPESLQTTKKSILAKAAFTWAEKGPVFSSDFDRIWSKFRKLEPKKGVFSAPCKRSLSNQV